MSTKTTKWTKEKSENRKEFRDETKRSHKQFRYTITKKEKQQMLATSDSRGQTSVLREEKRLASAIAVGSSPGDSDKALQNTIRKLRAEAVNEKDKLLMKEQTNNIQFESSSHEYGQVKLNQIKDKPCYLLLTNNQRMWSTNTENTRSQLKKLNLNEIKQQINLRTKKEITRESIDKISETRRQQVDEKFEKRKEEAYENLLLDSKILEADLKAKNEDKIKKEQKKIAQENFKSSLDKLCTQKHKTLLYKMNSKRKETECIRLSNKMYEEYKENEQNKEKDRKLKLFTMIKGDIAARKAYEQKIEDINKEEDERNFHYSIFKRVFGRKVRQHMKDKMKGKVL